MNGVPDEATDWVKYYRAVNRSPILWCIVLSNPIPIEIEIEMENETLCDFLTFWWKQFDPIRFDSIQFRNFIKSNLRQFTVNQTHSIFSIQPHHSSQRNISKAPTEQLTHQIKKNVCSTFVIKIPEKNRRKKIWCGKLPAANPFCELLFHRFPPPSFFLCHHWIPNIEAQCGWWKFGVGGILSSTKGICWHGDYKWFKYFTRYWPFDWRNFFSSRVFFFLLLFLLVAVNSKVPLLLGIGMNWSWVNSLTLWNPGIWNLTHAENALKCEHFHSFTLWLWNSERNSYYSFCFLSLSFLFSSSFFSSILVVACKIWIWNENLIELRRVKNKVFGNLTLFDASTLFFFPSFPPFAKTFNSNFSYFVRNESWGLRIVDCGWSFTLHWFNLLAWKVYQNTSTVAGNT